MRKSVHIQARLLRNNPDEMDAVAYWEDLIERKIEPRAIINAALNSLRQDETGQLRDEVNEVTISKTILRLLVNAHKIMERISRLDLSTLRNVDGSQVDMQQIQSDLSNNQKAAMKMLGDAKIFELGEDE